MVRRGKRVGLVKEDEVTGREEGCNMMFACDCICTKWESHVCTGLIKHLGAGQGTLEVVLNLDTLLLWLIFAYTLFFGELETLTLGGQCSWKGSW